MNIQGVLEQAGINLVDGGHQVLLQLGRGMPAIVADTKGYRYQLTISGDAAMLRRARSTEVPIGMVSLGQVCGYGFRLTSKAVSAGMVLIRYVGDRVIDLTCFGSVEAAWEAYQTERWVVEHEEGWEAAHAEFLSSVVDLTLPEVLVAAWEGDSWPEMLNYVERLEKGS